MNADCLFANLKLLDADNIEKTKEYGKSDFGI